jgi:hypothetical protein
VLPQSKTAAAFPFSLAWTFPAECVVDATKGEVHARFIDAILL